MSTPPRIFIVVWQDNIASDCWQAFDDLSAAQAFYAQLLTTDTLYSASICQPVQSTDYTCVSVL
jgi:hypothetical protein